MKCQIAHIPIISELQNILFQGPKPIYEAP